MLGEIEDASGGSDLLDELQTVTPEAVGKPVRAELKVGPRVPAESAAVSELLNAPLNIGRRVGFSYLLVDGFSSAFALTLDLLRLKHVIFANMTIIYNGALVDMYDVYFVNCNFKISRESSCGTNFAKTVLSTVPVTFTYLQLPAILGPPSF